MFVLFIIGLLLGAIAVVFALQNIVMVTVSFFAWHLQGSLAVIILLAITTGILITLLILLPGSIKNSWTVSGLRKDNKKLEEELRKQKELTHFAKHDAPTHSDISNIENGSIEHHNI
ncbi:LapA family protein [Patescibacteria group bacterium]|nr:LapA family protein [Patescibacteria group bacterium]